VDRPPDRRPDDQFAALERGVDIGEREAPGPREERDRDGRPVLRLDRADPLDGLDQRRVGGVEGFEQPLPGQQRAVQGVLGEFHAVQPRARSRQSLIKICADRGHRSRAESQEPDQGQEPDQEHKSRAATEFGPVPLPRGNGTG